MSYKARERLLKGFVLLGLIVWWGCGVKLIMQEDMILGVACIYGGVFWGFIVSRMAVRQLSYWKRKELP